MRKRASPDEWAKSAKASRVIKTIRAEQPKPLFDILRKLSWLNKEDGVLVISLTIRRQQKNINPCKTDLHEWWKLLNHGWTSKRITRKLEF